jgi:hypothetical protein
MKLEVTYEGEPDRIWLARGCAAGIAVSPPTFETLAEVQEFLLDLQHQKQ